MLTFKIFFLGLIKIYLSIYVVVVTISQKLSNIVITEMSGFAFSYNTINIAILSCSITLFSSISSNGFYENSYRYCISRDLIFSGVLSTRRKQGFSRDTNYVQEEGNN